MKRIDIPVVAGALCRKCGKPATCAVVGLTGDKKHPRFSYSCDSCAECNQSVKARHPFQDIIDSWEAQPAAVPPGCLVDLRNARTPDDAKRIAANWWCISQDRKTSRQEARALLDCAVDLERAMKK